MNKPKAAEGLDDQMLGDWVGAHIELHNGPPGAEAC